ncbi:unnamed protein product, partial [Staurois parvus]
MTADLWGGGGSGYLNLTGTRSHFRGVVLSSYLFLYPAARCLPGFCNGARHDSRVPSAHEREALALCDWSGGFWDLACVPGAALPFTKSTASCACALGTRLSCPHYRSR